MKNTGINSVWKDGCGPGQRREGLVLETHYSL